VAEFKSGYLISVQSTVSGNYKLVAELRQLPSNDAFLERHSVAAGHVE